VFGTHFSVKEVLEVVVAVAEEPWVVVIADVAVLVLISLVAVVLVVGGSFLVVVVVADGASVLGLLIELEHSPRRMEPSPSVHVPSGHDVQACKPKASP
jgi:type III secretory pathway component EscU